MPRTKNVKHAPVIYNDRRNEWELWYQSEVRTHGTDLEAILGWAEDHGYEAEVRER